MQARYCRKYTIKFPCGLCLSVASTTSQIKARGEVLRLFSFTSRRKLVAMDSEQFRNVSRDFSSIDSDAFLRMAMTNFKRIELECFECDKMF